MNCVGDTGNAFALLNDCWRHKRTGGGEQHILKLAAFDSVQYMAAKHRGAAAAAGASGVDVLLLPVVQHKPAVAVNLADVNAVLLEQVYKDFAAHQSKVAGKDKVEVGGRSTSIFKVGFNGVVGGRGAVVKETP